MLGIRNAHCRMHTGDQLHGDCFVAHVSSLEFKRGHISQKRPLLAQVDDSQLICSIVLRPRKLPDPTCHGHVVFFFFGFVVEAARVYPLNPNFPRAPSSSPSGRGKNWIDKTAKQGWFLYHASSHEVFCSAQKFYCSVYFLVLHVLRDMLPNRL